MTTTVTVMQLKNGQKIITIPKALADAKQLNKGDKVSWFINREGDLVLRKDLQ